MGADNSEKNGYIFNIDIWYEPNGTFCPLYKKRYKVCNSRF